MKYFKFTYEEVNGKDLLNQGEGVYYTSAEINMDEIKFLAKNILNNPSAVVNVPLVTEINYDTFVQEGGNPNTI